MSETMVGCVCLCFSVTCCARSKRVGIRDEHSLGRPPLAQPRSFSSRQCRTFGSVRGSKSRVELARRFADGDGERVGSGLGGRAEARDIPPTADDGGVGSSRGVKESAFLHGMMA